MPLVTLTVRKPKSSAFKSAVLDAVHAALVSAGVPATDKFQRVIELESDDFRFDPSYPDLGSARDDDFALIEILWSVGRSVRIKKKLLEGLMNRESLGVNQPAAPERPVLPGGLLEADHHVLGIQTRC